MTLQSYIGLAGIITGWVTIIIAIAINSWFEITRNALSDLGALTVEENLVFNIELAIAGIFALAYTFYLDSSIKNKLAFFSSGIYFVATVHLILIALSQKASNRTGLFQ